MTSNPARNRDPALGAGLGIDTSLPLAGARRAVCRRDLEPFGEFEALL
jgi:hypothetical protein